MDIYRYIYMSKVGLRDKPNSQNSQSKLQILIIQ